MKSIAGLFCLLCVVVDEYCVSSASTFRRRPIFHDETSTSKSLPPPEIVESSTARRRASRLSLPSNATSIRSDISDNFSCDGKAYGYYADVENDCQVFHVCLPVTYPDGNGQQFRWSFICPEDTMFNQEAFTCVRNDDMPFSCADSEQFYELNRYLGLRDEVSEEVGSNALDANDEKGSKLRVSDRRQSLRTTTTPSTTTTSTTTTTTTARPSTTQRREMSRIPIYRRTSTRRTTIPSSTAAPETVATTEVNTTPTDSPVEFAQNIEHRTSVDGPVDYTNIYDNALRTTTDLPTTVTLAETTFEDFVTTEVLPTRIVPDLIEVGENHVKSTDRTAAKITDELIQNIKQLQNILPASASIQGITVMNTPITSTPTAIEDQRRKRFLFTADAIENRKRLFNRLNTNKY